MTMNRNEIEAGKRGCFAHGMTSCVWLLAVCLFGVTGVASAQPVATPMHRLAWDQTEPAGLSYEISIDGGPAAPVLSVSCGPTACSGALPVSLLPGTREARLRAYRVTDGVRQESALSPPFAFVFVGDPSAPGNLRLEPPSQPSAVVSGTVGDPYDYAGLRVVALTLPYFGAQVFIGAPTLSSPEYAVQAGDHAAVAFWRP